MSSQVEICNMALWHLGVSKTIANVETEMSIEAIGCRMFYDNALKVTLKSFQWPFATIESELSLVGEDPNDEWAFSYQYPSDCIDAIQIQNEMRNQTRQSRIPFEIGKGDSGRLIFTDLEDAKLKYVSLVDDAEFYPEDFTLALSYKLAELIAPGVTAGDPFDIKGKCSKLFMQEISTAKANAANECQPDDQALSEFERSRS